MNNQLRPLIMIIIFMGVLLYAGALLWAGIESLSITDDKTPLLPEILTQIITVIGAALATHFGAIFGISQFTGGNPRPIPKFWQFNTWGKLPSRGKKVKLDIEAVPELQKIMSVPALAKADFKKISVVQEEEPDENKLDALQVIAVYVYFISLVLAFVFWTITGYKENVADVIKNLSYSLIGVIAGVASVILNVKKAT